MLDFQTIKDLLAGRSRDELATLTAYILAPGLVLALSGAGVYSPGLGLDFAKPVAVSQLVTEVNAQGKITLKKGIALMLEPVGSEYQIPLTAASSMWISLDADTIRANAGRLTLTERGFNGRSPFVGVKDPVTVVVQGEPGKDILVPGGIERLEDWRVQSRRAVSLVSSSLLACVFAFGMSLATGLPAIKAAQHKTSKIGAKPDKD